ncbi:asparagine synthetase domain-containing protein CG17486 [Chelonus insularis]|uniref:asparagine synthetase domain-containing protein CG17486 n=1 Tax=Chelonus insularis TaxID=460826 RepID=UPI00158F28E6|nr:asparagine synthetase domain-containing protein CG17486 [Chelonus insularis]
MYRSTFLMCGILCCIYQTIDKNKIFEINKWTTLKEQTAKRGPDILSTCQITTDHWSGEFVASVLWMQGSCPTLQPCVDEEGNILLWNGDIFTGILASNDDCDTLTLSTKLKSQNNVYQTLSHIEGPYSFIYFQKKTNTLYFGRDSIGRHSLLINIHVEDESPFLTLCSIAHKNIENIIELPAIGIFSMDLNASTFNLSCSPWHDTDDHFYSVIKNLNLPINIRINQSILPITIENSSSQLMNQESLNFIDIVNSMDYKGKEMLEHLLKDVRVDKKVSQLWRLLNSSVHYRVNKKPRFCQSCVKLVINPNPISNDECNCDHSKIGILFSGGLDSTILAAITSTIIPEDESIDLINVAFELTANKNRSSSSAFDVPDRKTGYQALEELKEIFPQRKWNFIEVNITREELQEYCSKHICHLIYPLRTILDESLGCALWFASRGSGVSSSTNQLYQSPCRVLLLGMGADELFGGYTRHRTILRRSGWDALTKELNQELLRIPERNLGRDDRIISDHGRQARFPFLDDNLVKYVRSLKSWERCCPIDKMPSGIGDKLLLRLLAYKIGLKETATFPKRAFQFGSRIANSKENAKDLSQWLK